ncbi:unnamed protein product [Rangifer tarandus platyrhynchus]|uniref:Uncharacterized protein n=1 Tax=Rangifer tarandus platyrhynchus TaxID=3082113 RepID=A0ABN8ZYA9_RANTA|nr:unnamed protein product [Rangifer tarandus platyrhynchus]
MIMVPANTGRADTLPVTVRSLSHGLVCDEVTQAIDTFLSRNGYITYSHSSSPSESKLGQAHRKWWLQLCRYDSRAGGASVLEKGCRSHRGATVDLERCQAPTVP